MHNGHKVAQIKFTSDAFGNGRGFDIEYKQVCIFNQIFEENLINFFMLNSFFIKGIMCIGKNENKFNQSWTERI